MPARFSIGSARRRQIVSSPLKSPGITLTGQSGNRFDAETSSNAAAGWCPRETTAGDLPSPEMLSEKFNTRRENISYVSACLSGANPDISLRDPLQTSGL